MKNKSTMPKVNVNLFGDEDIAIIINEAEKLIASNIPRQSEETILHQNIRDIESIRRSLNAYLAPLEPPPENAAVAGSSPTPTIAAEAVIDSVPISGPSRRVSIPNNIITTDPVIIVMSDDEDDRAIASNDQIVDLCTPEPTFLRRRRRLNNIAAPTEIIEIDDVFVEPKNKVLKIENTVVEKPSPCKNVTCPICLESPLHNTPASTKCGHVFCKECIVMSLKASKKCPICKRFCTEKSLLLLYI